MIVAAKILLKLKAQSVKRKAFFKKPAYEEWILQWTSDMEKIISFMVKPFYWSLITQKALRLAAYTLSFTTYALCLSLCALRFELIKKAPYGALRI